MFSICFFHLRCSFLMSAFAELSLDVHPYVWCKCRAAVRRCSRLSAAERCIIYIYIYIHTHMYVCITCMYVCACIYIYIYIYTHIIYIYIYIGSGESGPLQHLPRGPGARREGPQPALRSNRTVCI